MAREYFNFGPDNYQAKPFNLKFGQNTEGEENGYRFSSTMTLLSVYGENRQVSTVGVKKAKDFNFDAMFDIAVKSLKKKLKINSDSYQKKGKKERKRPQY